MARPPSTTRWVGTVCSPRAGCAIWSVITGHSITAAPDPWCAGPGLPATAAILGSRSQTVPGPACEFPGSPLTESSVLQQARYFREPGTSESPVLQRARYFREPGTRLTGAGDGGKPHLQRPARPTVS